jgi:hypothetical protein
MLVRNSAKLNFNPYRIYLMKIVWVVLMYVRVVTCYSVDDLGIVFRFQTGEKLICASQCPFRF